MVPETKKTDSTNSVDLIQYFDVKFKSIQEEIKHLYNSSKEKDSEIKNKIKFIEKNIAEMQMNIVTMKHKVEANTSEIEDMEKYKKTVDDLNTKISTIVIQLDSIQSNMEKKQKSTLAIAIAIFSPIITAGILWFFTSTWQLKTQPAPVQPPVQPQPTTYQIP